MSASSAPRSTPHGPGRGCGAPNLPAGFTDTFTSRYIDTGELRQHPVIGGDGPPLLLVHGWPQTWHAWRLLMPALARDFQVIAVDQRGIGLSDKPKDGYDTGTLAGDLVALMDTLGQQRFAVVGHDTGLIISYALAADRPDRVERLVLVEVPGPPGVAPAPPLFVPEPINNRLWHIPFNRANDELTEQLVRGRIASPTPTPCAAASGSTAPGTPPWRGTSSARPGRWRCRCWRSAERKAGASRSGTGSSLARTTCRPWSSPAPAAWSPSRLRGAAGRADPIPGPLPRPRVNPRKGDHHDPSRDLHGRYRSSPLPGQRS